MPMSKSEISSLVKESLKLVPIGKTPADVAMASTFYQFMFTHYPDLRKYFKGAEKFTAEDVRKSERFDRNGTNILLAVYCLAYTFEHEPTFRAIARQEVAIHEEFDLDPSLWSKFFTIFVKFLETKGKLTTKQKQAWKELGAVFNDECQIHLKELGLPYC